MKTKEIRDLIDFISKSGLNEVNIETEELKLSVKRDAEIKAQVMDAPIAIPAAAPAQLPAAVASAAPTSAEAAAAPAKEVAGDNYLHIKSPMIGTFYRSANPESPVFVSVGDKVEVGQTVCIVEAMKLFNEIESEVAGTVVQVMVENSSPIEYDQVLFVVDPA